MKTLFENNMDLSSEAERIWRGIFDLRIPTSVLNDPDYYFEDIKGKRDYALERIEELLSNGINVKAGWASTAVRGFHDYYIYYKI